LWFLQQFEPDSPAYNMPGRVRIQGALDSAALSRCLAEIIRRHEVLRTRFEVLDGQPMQVVDPPGAWELPEQDLRHLPADEREAAVAESAAAVASHPFDLAGGPLLRATLLRLDEAEHALLLALHHIVADQWSVAIFVQE